jgi:flagellar basal-body rod protein FlgB
MLQGMFQSNAIPVLEEVAKFAQARHAVLAGNLANLNTPGYRVRDLSVEDFQARLRQAVEQRHAPPAFESPGHVAEDNGDGYLAQVAEQSKTILFHDGSNVSLEQQVTEMAKNQVQHNLALALMNHQFRQLEAAISERV